MMIDASCHQCGKRIGWSGTMRNRPACQRCGHRPPQEELEREAAEMEAFQERLRTNPLKASADVRRQQRLDAGLTLRQAAKLLDLYPSQLSEIEQGKAEPTINLAFRMGNVYGLTLEGERT